LGREYQKCGKGYNRYSLCWSGKNPTGWVLWKNKVVSAGHLYENQKILEHLTKFESTVITIGAPLNLPKKRTRREADRERYRHGYLVFSKRSSRGKVDLTHHENNSTD
jgi:predicted nuclease with RNAse H fold